MQRDYQRNSYSASTRATENRFNHLIIRVALEVEHIQTANAVHDPSCKARIAREVMIIDAAIETGLFTVERGENTTVLNACIKLRDLNGMLVARVLPRVCADKSVTFSAEVDGNYEKALISREGVEGWCEAMGQKRREAAALAAKLQEMEVTLERMVN